MNIETKAQLLELKNILNNIGHVSYTYKQLQTKPFDDLTESEALFLIYQFLKLIRNVKDLIATYER